MNVKDVFRLIITQLQFNGSSDVLKLRLLSKQHLQWIDEWDYFWKRHINIQEKIPLNIQLELGIDETWVSRRSSYVCLVMLANEKCTDIRHYAWIEQRFK